MTAEDLRALSDAAPPGRWEIYHGDGIAQATSLGHVVVSPGIGRTTAVYIVALVNAHRAGQGPDAQDDDDPCICGATFHLRLPAAEAERDAALAECARLRAQVAAVEAGTWSCTTDHVTHPGCGRCLMCRRALAAGWTALAGDDQ